ncbi:MAG: TetR/AcrR family transcriptional regulator [bacterium]
MTETIQKSTKDIILENALELFSRKGFYAVSVREITRQVGIKESSLYNHFTSKNEIMDAIIDWLQAELDDYFEKTIQKNTEEPIPEYLDIENVLVKRANDYIRFWDDPFREKLWFIISLEQYRNSKIAEIWFQDKERMFDIQKDLFQKWADRGIIRCEDPEILAMIYIEVIRSVHLEYRLFKTTSHSKEKTKKRVRQFIAFFVHKLQATEIKV